MVRKSPGVLPDDVEQVLTDHGLGALFAAMSHHAQDMYLEWIEADSDRRRRRIELLIRALRRRAE
jgi:hypothetical protein